MNPDFGDPAKTVLDLLTRAANDRRSPLRWPVLATRGDDDGWPGARMLVVRAFDRTTLQIELHTDRRSAKCAALQTDPACALLFFDKGAMVQLRVDGRARVHAGGDPAADAAFARAPEGSLDDYRGPPPGAAPDAPGSDDARANFAAIRISLERADLLKISRDGHQRAFIDFRSEPPTVRGAAP
ncbi:MAG: pyridoxamine 5'-phosphate oxidase family protein [Oceanicaulis sp.]